MKFFEFLIVFSVFFSIFHWIIRKTDFHNKLFSKYKNHKYIRNILVLVIIFLTFSFEYGKQLLNDKYGQHNYISIIIGAFLGAIYLNFAPIIFRKNNW